MSQQQITPFLETQEEELNIKDVLSRYLSNWKWLTISVFACTVVAFFYLRTVTPQYKSTAKILIKEEKKGALPSGMDIFEDLGLAPGSANLENEIEILKSLTLIKKVVHELKLNNRITLKDNEQATPFLEGPFILSSAISDSLLGFESGSFEMDVKNGTSFSLTEEESQKNIGTFTFGKAFKSPIGEIVIDKTKFYSAKDNNQIYTVHVSPIQSVASSLQKRIDISAVNKDASVLIISLEGPSIDKNNTIINTLIRLHELSAVEDKNQITKTTSEFINDRMKVITEELSIVEVEGQDYKTAKSLTDLTSDAQLFLEKNNELEGSITQVSIQLEMAEYMNNYLAQQTGYDVLLPSNLGFEDATVAATINQYNTNALERNRLLQSSNENNPVVKKMEGQLSSLKRSLVASLNNMRSSLKIKLKKLESEERQNQSKISSIPEYEREYRSIARQQQIKETLYLYLLQKREENEIAMAATIGNVKIIDEPYSDNIAVSPKKKIIMLGAFLIGILIPIGFIYIKDLLDNKIRTIKDIESLNLPYVGDVPFNDLNETIVVGTGKRSAISESFRMLRTNMNFLLHQETEGGRVIAVTSSIKGEGKTFIALNLATSICLTDKKVLLIGMDLRSPKLTQILNLSETRGVTNYLVDHKLTHQEIITKDPENANMDFMISGPIPPNPSELLHSSRLKDLIAAVRHEYDYIIIDTAPVGMVVDTQLIAPLADLTLYVARANYADKRLMQIPKNLNKEEKIKNIAMILNDVKDKNTRSYYGYGYGYGYGTDEEAKKSFFSRLKK